MIYLLKWWLTNCDYHGYHVVVYKNQLWLYVIIMAIPVVPHKAVAEVSKIGNL